jgi:hypothetical protein
MSKRLNDESIDNLCQKGAKLARQQDQDEISAGIASDSDYQPQKNDSRVSQIYRIQFAFNLNFNIIPGTNLPGPKCQRLFGCR